MLFRFWGGNGRGAEAGDGGTVSSPGRQAAGHHPGLLALIEDAVASKQGISHAAAEYLYILRLKRPADALVVSRQVQLGLEGFRARHGGGPVAVSIAIHAGGEGAGESKMQGDAAIAQEPPHDLVTLLKLAKPAQILLTHDLCEQVTAFKGLPLRSFPARFGVYEYLWAAEEKLELLQSEPQLTLAALPAAAPPTEKPTKEKPAKEKNDAGAATADAGTVAAPAAAASAAKAKTKRFEPPAFAARQEDDFEEAKSGVPRWAIFGGAGLAALVAIAALAIHLMQKPVANPAPAQVTPAGNASPVAAPARPSARQTAHVPAVQIPEGQIRGGQVPAPVVQKPHAAAQAPAPAPQQVATPAPAPEIKPAAPSADCTLGGDTSRYVSLAEQSRGRGDYANAIRIFREVLACDANNAAAREGLEKATQAQQQSK
jgi:hypothetical protein